MHSKINNTYSHITLANDDGLFKKISEAFERAAKYLHKKGDFNSEDLTHKEVKPLIKETYNVLKQAVSTGITTKVPDAMLNKLQEDVFVFSGMKTYTQLKEASLLLMDENEQIKSYTKFEQDILKIDKTYNQNYLQAEYQHAIASAQSTAQYHEYMQDADRYNLQIRTAGDDKVRDSHAALNGITRPANDPYWHTTWTPFDWRCRCRIIQVLKDKYAATDEGIANAAVQQAVPEMFRYNPGRQQIVFPKKHPYYPQHCNGAKLNVTGLVGFANWLLDAENDRCKAMQVIKSMKDTGVVVNIKQRTKDFNKYNKDNNYTDVAFNKNTGGLKATHRLHNFDKHTGKYEKAVRDILFKNGDKIILEKENLQKGETEKKGTKKVDGYFNNLTYDISTVLTTGKYTIKNKFSHAMSKNAEVAIIYFPKKEMYNKAIISDGLVLFRRYHNYSFKKIIIIAGEDIIQ